MEKRNVFEYNFKHSRFLFQGNLKTYVIFQNLQIVENKRVLDFLKLGVQHQLNQPLLVHTTQSYHFNLLPLSVEPWADGTTTQATRVRFYYVLVDLIIIIHFLFLHLPSIRLQSISAECSNNYCLKILKKSHKIKH